MQVIHEPRMDITGVNYERIPDNLLLEPIEFVFADHCRQISIFHALNELTEQTGSSPPDPRVSQAILTALENDFTMHIVDEEMDLYPRLRTRVLPSDDFTEIERRQDDEHGRDAEPMNAVCAELRLIVGDAPATNPEGFRKAVVRLTGNHLSHLNWENRVVLALARKRLNAEDQRAMGRAMAARRGIVYPGD